MNITSNLRQLDAQLLQAAYKLQLALPEDHQEQPICMRVQQVRKALVAKQEERLTRAQSQTITDLLGTLGQPARVSPQKNRPAQPPLQLLPPPSIPSSILGLITRFSPIEEASPTLQRLATTLATTFERPVDATAEGEAFRGREKGQIAHQIELFLQDPTKPLDLAQNIAARSSITDCDFLIPLFEKATSEQLHAIVQALVTHMPHLESFSFHNCPVTPATLDLLQNCKNLRSLSLKAFPIAHGGRLDITDLHLTAISKLTNLTSLTLERCELTTSAGFQALRSLVKLEKFQAHSCIIGPSEFELLSQLPNLQSLWLCDLNFTQEFLQSLGHFPQLQSLELSFCRLPETALQQIAKSKNLKKLHLNNCTYASQDLPYFASMQSLTELHLGYCSIQREGGHKTRLNNDDFVHIANCSQLRVLDLANADIGNGRLALLSGMKTLEELDASYTQITDNDLAYLASLTHMRLLSIGNTQITDAGLAHLLPLQQLRELRLFATRITNNGLQHIAQFPLLRCLLLNQTGIDNNGLIHLGKLLNLSKLSLTENQIGDAGLQHLQQLTKMQTLSLGATQITTAGLQYLHQMAELTDLELFETAVDDSVIDSLQHWKSLCRLLLGHLSLEALQQITAILTRRKFARERGE